MEQGRIEAESGTESAALQASDWAATQFDAAPGAAGVWLDQRPRSASVWSGLRVVDAVRGGKPDRAEISHSTWRIGGRRIARQVGTDTAKATATRLSARSG